ncbi:Galactose mutarotase-like protein [Venustampulla echinocandica]|uniref:Galactose mutarotase-like protein n=1 Tax=Venustampulla echinocandica TaxID=2656787 RepID=A0A370TXH0_9HELO|nr:Galactose mutarotase-like protein [Venustampulla echinocandica]RDL40231.1 Galactose mutarotase-like protein [Venustampulla echinocandica]
MRVSTLGFALWALAVLARPQTPGQTLTGTVGNDTIAGSSSGPDKNGKYEISGIGIRADFIAYGASISNLFLNDSAGVERDVVGGFDNASYYSVDRQHPHFGGVPGRYANRIKNSSFVIDGTTYNILPNDNPLPPDHPEGVDTLHGGPNGWDWRNWTVVAHTSNSITFSITDQDGDQGFPGEVVSYVTYTLGNMTWDIRMVALATTKVTPIMLSSHTYWNLDGFANNNTATALNHSLWLPYSGERVGVDSILIPTGDILSNQPGSVNDFWSTPKQIGANFSNPDLLGNCGENCTGYDNCYVNNLRHEGTYDWREQEVPVARLRSAWSGIQLDVFTDQDAFQVYSCGGQNGSMALKNTQGLSDVSDRPRTIQQYGCVVLEVQDYIDGINQPQWGRGKKQIFEPGGDPYVLQASYRFSLNDTMMGLLGPGSG